MYHTISFIVPSINFMAPSVDWIVLTWFGNIYPAHYSNCHVCHKYQKSKAIQRYGYNAIACCNLKTEAVKTLPLSLYSIFYHYNIIQCHNFDDYITLSSYIGSMKLNVSFASSTIVILSLSVVHVLPIFSSSRQKTKCKKNISILLYLIYLRK